MDTIKSPGAVATASEASTNFRARFDTPNRLSRQGLVAYQHRKAIATHSALPTLFEETFANAPLGLQQRLYASITPTLAGDCLVHLARVRFESYRFDLDTAGQWAVIAPIIESGLIVDFGAFSASNDDARRVFGLGHFAVGLEDATFDMRLHPKSLMLMHYSVWSWLRCECTGVLPIQWKETALHVARDAGGLLFDHHIEERKAEARLQRALALPPIFVREEVRAA